MLFRTKIINIKVLTFINHNNTDNIVDKKKTRWNLVADKTFGWEVKIKCSSLNWETFSNVYYRIYGLVWNVTSLKSFRIQTYL